MLVPDGVYVNGKAGPIFQRVAVPTGGELQQLVSEIGRRLGRQLERAGLLGRDAQSAYLALESEQADGLTDLQGHSITYRIALGPQRGRKAFQLQTLPPRSEDSGSERVAQAAGFSLHAGVATEAEQCDRLERICRYVSRAAVANERLSLTPAGQVRYALKSAYRDGTTHVIFEPLDFLSRLAALVPKPKVNLTRFGTSPFFPTIQLRPGLLQLSAP
jgi:hypothetical protein